MKRDEFLRTAVLGGGAVLWAPCGFGQTSAVSYRAPWIFPHVRPWPPHPHPYPIPPPRPWRSPVEVERVDVEVSIARQAATTTMVILLRNPASAPQEGQAILPVPRSAMLRSFSMEGGGDKITAELLSRDEARRIYDSIVRQLRDPALLEFAGLGAVKSNVFPVPAHGSVRLRMVYEELLDADAARIDYVLPRSESLDIAVPWSIRVRWTADKGLADVYSPSHEIEKRRISRKSMEISVCDGKTSGSFRLSALMRGKDGLAAGLLTHPGDRKAGGWFLLFVTPPERKSDRQVLREVTLVLDRSGSMAGEKLDQARAAALQVIEGLNDGESFNLIVYNEAVERFAEQAVEVNRASVLRARQWINALRVSGGTNIHDALDAAVRQPSRDGAIPIVLFLTDGLPTIGETSEKRIREKIRANNHAKRRIFTFGVGVDVNSPLLSRLADDSRATASFVLPGENVELEVARVFKRLSGPSLSEPILVALDRDGRPAPGRVTDVIPSRLPDFYENDQVVIAGRWTGGGPLRFRVDGLDAGKRRRFHFAFKPDRTSHPFVPRLWATRKIAILTEALRDLGADREKPDRSDPRIRELVGEIVRLSTRYGVMSEYTAFLARDGGAFAPQARREVAAADAFYSRAVESRSGAGAANQESNLWRQKQAAHTNPTNGFLNAELQQEEVREVRQLADKAFYRRGSQWVDANLLVRADGSDEVVTIGSEKFHGLVDRLVAENRQSCLALGSNSRIEIDGTSYLIK